MVLKNDTKLKTVFFLSLIAGIFILFECVMLSKSFGIHSGTKLSISLLVISGTIVFISALILSIDPKHHVLFGLLIVLFSAISLLAIGFHPSIFDISYFIVSTIVMIFGVVGGVLGITYDFLK